MNTREHYLKSESSNNPSQSVIQTKGATFQKYPAYKDSGVEWLGKIPKEWETVRMKYLFRDVSVKNKPEEELLSVTQDKGVIPRTWVENRMVMPSGNLESFKYIQKGDFAISLRSFEGGLEYCHHNGIISPAYTVLKKKAGLADSYYKYLFKSYSFISEIQTSVVGIREGKNISYPELSYSLLPIPPLLEQTAIANFLDDKTAKIDRAIAQKEKLIALLKERKQIIIQNAVTKGLDPNVKLKDSGVEWIGEIPEHWEIKKLKNICKTYGRIGFRGYSTSDLVNKGEGVITISPSNIHGDFMSFDKCTYLSWEKYHESPEIKIFKNDILIVKTGSSFGKVGYASNLESDATINPQLIVFKAVEIDTEYFYEVLNSKQIQIQINKEVIGSTIPTISEAKILNMKAGFPPSMEIPKIVEKVKYIKNKFNAAIASQIDQIEKLKEYKATLIDSAVTGKIKVS